MSEARWYAHVRDAGERPKMRRLSRLAVDVQWRAPIQLAIAIAVGRAHWRNTTNAVTGEETWFWQGPFGNDGDTGWWLVPPRICGRARKLIRMATLAVTRRPGGAGYDSVELALRRWRRSGAWERQLRRAEAGHDPQWIRPQPGRRNAVLPSYDAASRQCSICSERGHSSRTCPLMRLSSTAVAIAVEVAAAKPERACGVCREVGHNKRTCPHA